MERILASEGVVATVDSLFCGIILANFAISSDVTLKDFAPVPLSSAWSYAVALLCGFALAVVLDGIKWMLYAVGLAALSAVMILSSVLMLAVPRAFKLNLDFVLLFSFQQSFPRFLVFSVMGCIGAVVAIEAKRLIEQHL